MVGRFIAMLALDQPYIVAMDDLVSGLRERVPELGGEIAGRPYRGDRAAASEAYIVSVSGRHFAVAFVGRPAPDRTFDVALNHSRDSWPDGGSCVAGHKAHIVLSNLDLAGSFEEAVDAAGSVTLLAGVLNAMAPTIAVYWANGEVLLPRNEFEAMTEMLISGDPPVGAWINIRNHLDSSGIDGAPVIGVSTLGLDSFCGREIESAATPTGTSRARDRVLAVSADILRNGPGLADNSVLKIGGDETIIVNLEDEGSYQPGQPVIRLTPQQAEPAGNGDDADTDASDLPPLFARRKRSRQFAT